MHPTTTAPTVTITREQIERWAGRPLSDDEVTRLDECIPCSSIPTAIETIVAHFEQPDDEDTDDEDRYAGRSQPTACQLCGAPGQAPYCTTRPGRAAVCADVIELHRTPHPR